MPVIIAPADRDRWMNPDEAPDDLLRPYPAELMEMWPVSTRVNSPKNDDRELIEPIALPGGAAENADSGVPRANEADAEPADSE